MRLDWWEAAVAWLLADGQAMVVLGILAGSVGGVVWRLVRWIAAGFRRRRKLRCGCSPAAR